MHISFLEVIGELSFKLIKQDRQALKTYLDGFVNILTDEQKSASWTSYYKDYGKSLIEGKSIKRANVNRQPFREPRNTRKQQQPPAQPPRDVSSEYSSIEVNSKKYNAAFVINESPITGLVYKIWGTQ